MRENDPRAAAEYLVGMCDELAKMAERERWSMGAYLLCMASLEFQFQRDQLPDSPAKRESIR